MSARLPLSPTLRMPNRLGGTQGRFLWLEHLARFWRAHETRRQLSELDAHLLRDIGVTPTEAQREASRKPWDLGGR